MPSVVSVALFVLLSSSLAIITCRELPEVRAILPVSTSEKVTVSSGLIEVKPRVEVTLKLFGSFLLKARYAAFSKHSTLMGENCDDTRVTKPLSIVGTSDTQAQFTVTLDPPPDGDTLLTLCIKYNDSDSKSGWHGQGENAVVKVLKESIYIPVWLRISIIIILLTFSGLFSGLNLGIMSLDPTELRIINATGSRNEQKYAKRILPLRQRGNLLLCTILLGNTIVNSTITILLDDLSTGVVAVIGSTLAIVIFGEIIPQSVCSRYGLAVGAHTTWVMVFFLILTFPLSYPISKCLDCILGDETPTIYNRHVLLEMIKMHYGKSDLHKDEVGIISGALNYKRQIVKDIMTPLNDCFLLSEDAVLDYQTMSDILKSGFSRIPVYSCVRTNIIALLFVKDLAFVDPDSKIPLWSVIRFYKHPLQKVFSDTTLDKVLEQFKRGISHLAIVVEVAEDKDGDPVYNAIGIVTLEDVIEEIIQSEIVDETDETENSNQLNKTRNRELAYFMRFDESHPLLTAQQSFVAFQFLSTSLEPFSESLVSKHIVKRMVNLPEVVQRWSLNGGNPSQKFLYQKDVPCDFFTLILEGRAQVTIGQDNLIFEAGPYSFFGVSTLTGAEERTYRPDFSLTVLSDVTFLKVTTSLYKSMVHASLAERSCTDPGLLSDAERVFVGHAPPHGMLDAHIQEPNCPGDMNIDQIIISNSTELSPLIT